MARIVRPAGATRETNPASPGRGRGTAPARPSAWALETASLRFARDASVAAGAQFATAQDEGEH